MARTTAKTFCRFCLGCCGIEVDVEDGRPVALRGDTSNPLTGGYTCQRGRELTTMHTHPDRIREPLKRVDGRFVPVPLEEALAEIAARTGAILARDGGRAVASYNGSWAYSNFPTLAVSKAFHRAIGSPSVFSPMSLDQPAKAFAPFRFGLWSGGAHTFSDADVALFIGNNPLVSQYAAKGGLPVYNPWRRLQDALDAGLRLVVIDPRRSDVARRATLHLQPYPGEDPVLLAAMLRTILGEGLHDQAFCARWADGLEALGAALAPFTPDYAARRAGVPAADIVEAARLFAGGRRGSAVTGTGPEMAPDGWLGEHLVLALNTVCGRYYREGEVPRGAPPLSPAQPARAEVFFPPQPWGEGFARSRFRGLTQLGDEMPCNVMADEILTPGEGRIRALFVLGGNPVVAFPNQRKIARAMEDLELLVAVDPWMSATARRAHFILPPKLQLERADATQLGELYFEEAYAHYTEAVLPAAPGLIEEWELYRELARRLGLELQVNGAPLPLEGPPDKHALMEQLTRGARLPLARLRAETATQGGRLYPELRQPVGPARPGAAARFRLLPPEIAARLAAVAAEPLDADGRPARTRADGATHLLSSRRIRQFFNSTGHNFPALRAKGSTNHAYLNPADLAALGIAPDTPVEIRSAAGAIVGIAMGAEDIRPGVVSMAHAFGDTDSDLSNVRAQGSSTNALVSDEQDYDPVTGQARQSAIPVRIRALQGEGAGQASPAPRPGG